ncbi:hypothetical protein TIFTF001_012715 [Ficus carica]|uniref:Uncharacterized protein n=1 Tax=Ficus carica TaxID=3494 RepID=A0AA88ANQ4_FICCA|nr:hypothetical protein TIFTF001_012715 [Ficus carica]
MHLAPSISGHLPEEHLPCDPSALATAAAVTVVDVCVLADDWTTKRNGYLYVYLGSISHRTMPSLFV